MGYFPPCQQAACSTPPPALSRETRPRQSLPSFCHKEAAFAIFFSPRLIYGISRLLPAVGADFVRVLVYALDRRFDNDFLIK
jgi:hypothetical protein